MYFWKSYTNVLAQRRRRR